MYFSIKAIALLLFVLAWTTKVGQSGAFEDPFGESSECHDWPLSCPDTSDLAKICLFNVKQGSLPCHLVQLSALLECLSTDCEASSCQCNLSSYSCDNYDQSAGHGLCPNAYEKWRAACAPSVAVSCSTIFTENECLAAAGCAWTGPWHLRH
jgi:hypothetical protein